MKQKQKEYKQKPSKVADMKPLEKKNVREERFRCLLYFCCVSFLLGLLGALLTIFILFSLRPGFDLKLQTNEIQIKPANSTLGDIYVYYEGLTGFVDASQFGLKEASVACKQLNFSKAVAYTKNLFTRVIAFSRV